MVSMDTLVVKIIDFAQHLVQADRASLFLLDSKTNELYARIFDYGCTVSEEGQSLSGRDVRQVRNVEKQFSLKIGIDFQ